MRRRLVFAACLAVSVAGATWAAAAATVSHEIRMRLDPGTRALRVEDRFTVHAEGAIGFDLAPWLRLVAAKVDGRVVQARRTGRQVRLPAPGAGGRMVELDLQGSIPALPDRTARRASTGAVSGAEGAYLPGWSAWMADVGDDRIRYRLTIDVPAAYRVVATGRLVAERREGDSYRVSIAADHPGELPSVFAGPYQVAERLAGAVRIRTYFHRELAGLAEAYLQRSAAYIGRYADQIGAYPYADFHVVSAPLPVGLGFPNLTYVGRRVLALPFMRGRSLAHEILHNWWGNGVAVDYAKGNWAEGLTTYLADHAVAVERSADAARELRLGWLRNFTALPSVRDMPVDRFVAKHHDAAQAIGYDKVAFIFHMLRRELGETAFGAGVRQFWKSHQFRVAAWSDLQHAFEQAASTELAWFFEQWLRRKGAPRIELADARRTGREGAYRATVMLRQGSPPYRVRVPVVTQTRGGTHHSDLILEKPEQRFVIPVERMPLSVHIDPNFDTFRKLLPGESPPIFRDVTLSRETVVFSPTDDAAMARTARQLAGRLLQRQAPLHRGDPRDLPNVPVLVIGAAQDIEALRARIGFSPAVEIAGMGTARAWTERRPNGQPWLYVAAGDAESLGAVMRPLPHYRSQSYVVFDGAKAITKGIWRAPDSPLRHRFAD